MLLLVNMAEGFALMSKDCILALVIPCSLTSTCSILSALLASVSRLPSSSDVSNSCSSVYSGGIPQIAYSKRGGVVVKWYVVVILLSLSKNMVDRCYFLSYVEYRLYGRGCQRIYQSFCIINDNAAYWPKKGYIFCIGISHVPLCL
jgi:hypothetical protein